MLLALRAACGCRKGSVVDEPQQPVDVLVLGLSGAGKTLLIRRLQGLHEPRACIHASTFPTTGTETSDVPCREVGGCMVPIWPRYYDECQALMFVVDASALQAAPAASAQLASMLQDKLLQDKACLLVLNKADSHAAAPYEQLSQVLGLRGLSSICTGPFHVQMLSALEGGPGVAAALAWLIDEKAKRQR